MRARLHPSVRSTKPRRSIGSALSRAGAPNYQRPNLAADGAGTGSGPGGASRAWQKSGLVTRRGNTVAAVVESVPAAVPKAATRPVHVTRQVTPAITPSAGLDAAAYLAAVGLAAVAA